MGCLVAGVWGGGEAAAVGVKVTTLGAHRGLGTCCGVPQVTVGGRKLGDRLRTWLIGKRVGDVSTVHGAAHGVGGNKESNAVGTAVGNLPSTLRG